MRTTVSSYHKLRSIQTLYRGRFFNITCIHKDILYVGFTIITFPVTNHSRHPSLQEEDCRQMTTGRWKGVFERWVRRLRGYDRFIGKKEVHQKSWLVKCV